MDKTIVKDGWLYRNGFLRKNCKKKINGYYPDEKKKEFIWRSSYFRKNLI